MTTPYADPQGIHNPATGNSPPASWGDNVRDNLQTLSAPPGCIVSRTATQSIATSAETAIQFNAADIRDTDNYHDTVTNNTRMTVPSGFGGLYRLTAVVSWDVGATGVRSLFYKISAGASVLSDQSLNQGASFAGWNSFSREILLSVGQYVEVTGFQTNGGALNLTGAEVSLTWMGRL